MTANNNDTFPLFRGLPKAFFSDLTYPSGVGRQTLAYTGWSNGIFDFDNDGNKDLFAACGAIDNNVEAYSHRKSRHPNLMLVNLGNKRFADVTAGAGADFHTAGRHRGAAFGDYDGDGRIDVVVSRIGEPAELFRNVTPASNHWLGLRLRGTRSNRDAIGALRLVEPAEHVQSLCGIVARVRFAGSEGACFAEGCGCRFHVARLQSGATFLECSKPRGNILRGAA